MLSALLFDNHDTNEEIGKVYRSTLCRCWSVTAIEIEANLLYEYLALLTIARKALYLTTAIQDVESIHLNEVSHLCAGSFVSKYNARESGPFLMSYSWQNTESGGAALPSPELTRRSSFAAAEEITK